MQIRTLLIIFITSIISVEVYPQTKADDIVGIWLTAGKEPAKIQIYVDGGKFYGKIIWLQNPIKDSKARLDNNNPDEEKKTHPIVGLVILKGFKFDGDDEWKGGEIYDPESGKTYSSNISLKNKNTINVRGYVGISLFGRTETWTRSD